VGRFLEPVHVNQPPGSPGLLFVVEKRGVIRVVRRGRKLQRPFLDLRRRVRDDRGDEEGLLSLAFPPDYRESRRLYVAFTDNRDDLQVQEFRRSLHSPAVALRRSGRRVLRIPERFPTHHGGLLLFDRHGRLYIGSGDGGSVGDPFDNAQNKRTLRGKILRIKPLPRGRRSYTTPRSNPFHGRHGRNEIYVMGLRNPWRFSFDPSSGALLIADVGQNVYEEVDWVPRKRIAGANFGWAAFEGNHRFKRDLHVRRPVFPVITYRHFPRCSIIGGYVVRDPGLPLLRHRYVYGDYCTGELFSFLPGPPPRPVRTSRELPLEVPLLTSFGEDLSGHLYATSLDGPVYRIVQR
jgi:glucose/arabinose dehydrogenase